MKIIKDYYLFFIIRISIFDFFHHFTPTLLLKKSDKVRIFYTLDGFHQR